MTCHRVSAPGDTRRADSLRGTTNSDPEPPIIDRNTALITCAAVWIDRFAPTRS